jgi:hypothetical protein
MTLLSLAAANPGLALPAFKCGSEWLAKIREAAPAEAPAKPSPGRKVLVFSLATGFKHW